MKIHELLAETQTNPEVDEGFKSALAGLALSGAALAGGAQAGTHQKDVIGDIISQKQAATQVAPAKVAAKKIAPHATIAAAKTANPMADIKPAAGTTVTGNSAEPILKAAAMNAGIRGTELAAFLAQCAHETLDFKLMKEKGGSLDFRKYDPRYRPGKAAALGNTQVGDGAKFKGRGFIQITGRDNYRRAGQALGLPLEKHPEMAEKPEVAAKIAIWFWQNRVSPKVTNFNDTSAVTKHINPSMHGLDSRQDRFDDFKALITPQSKNPIKKTI